MHSPANSSRAAFSVVFDGDDTLWSTELLYDDARSAAGEVVAAAGLDADEWEKTQRRLDVQNVARLGYSQARFPTSCVQAYEEVCHRAGREPDPVVSATVRRLARSVFERDPPLVPDARDTLSRLRSQGVRLALLTKGDPEVQWRRIERSGLKDFFDVIHVVADKTPQAVRTVVAALGSDPQSTWMVGNSVRSDVLPALAAGLRAIWVDAHVWEHERSHEPVIDERVITATHLGEVVAVTSA